MKNMKFKYCLTLFATISFIVALNSCNSDFLDTVPNDAVSSENVWTSSSLAKKVVDGVYNILLDDYDNNPHEGLWDAYSILLDIDKNWMTANIPLLAGVATPSSDQFSRFWKRFYEGVHRTNDVIANISKVPDMSDEDKAKYIAECKFLRAWFYMRLNILWKGVPLYLEPVEVAECTKGRSSESQVWDAVITDLTACINEQNLPLKYNSGNSDYGRITKGAAYALRGKAYLWMKEYGKAEQDFKSVGTCGYSLFPNFGTLFKEANERCDEMIFSVQCVEVTGLGNVKHWTFGSRVTKGSSWSNYLPNPDFVDSYEFANGKTFNFDDVLPGYSNMTPKQRSVYFLRDNMTTNEIGIMTTFGSDMSKYLPNGNEARIKAAYVDRDPRMLKTIITPYSTFLGGVTGQAIDYTLRWPYRGSDAAEPYDVRTDTNSKFYYLIRKFVYEGVEHTIRNASPIDMPLIRYADVLLNLAEALNEQGKTDEAIGYVNMVRSRAGVAKLNSNNYTTVTGQDDLRKRIQNERYWELAGEDVMYFDELRWGTWKDKKFSPGNGLTEIWGTVSYTYSWVGEQGWTWAIPAAEMEMNTNLEQNSGWNN